MVQKEIEAKVPAKVNAEDPSKSTLEMSAVIVVNYADSLDEALDMYGEEAVLTNAFANWRVTIQAGIRSALKSGLTAEQIQAKYADAKMGVAATGGRVDAQTAFIAKFKMATPEGQAAMLELLKEAAQS